MYIRVWSKKKNGPFQRSTTKTIPTPASSGFLQQASKQAGRQANAQVATTRDTMRGDRQ
jgi:hypothetical protein